MLHILRIVATVAAVFMVGAVLWDAFETVVLPRRVSHRFRLARMYYRGTWRSWSALAGRIPSLERRENILAIYGPIALLALLALWVFLLIVAYALLLWGLGSPLTVAAAAGHAAGFGSDLYFSGTTFLTLGLGDVIPQAGSARGVAVVEVGTGFGMLALVIGYLPVLYQAFSRREMRISLLDAHAGSPPTAGSLLLRHSPVHRARTLTALLAEWEGWSAELLETHLSYPVLAYYRSQHENQSWVAALAVILDTCALVLACGPGVAGSDGDTAVDEELAELREQAAVTFAMARHAAVDLAQVFRSPAPRPRAVGKGAPADGRLPPAERVRLRDVLMAIGVEDIMPTARTADATVDATEGDAADEVEGRIIELDTLRWLYEPYLEGLAAFLLLDLPPWIPAPGALDDWQTTADGVTAPSVAALVERERRGRTERSVPPDHAGR